MKNSLLTVLLFASTTLMAQSLTTDNFPLRGEQKLYYLLDEGASSFEAETDFGAVWDYSDVAGTGETSLGKVLYASEVDYGENYHEYSSATIFEGVMSIFSLNNEGTLYANGIVFNDPAYGPAIASFNAPTAMYDFPFEYNQSYSVALAGNFAVTTNSGDIDGPFTGNATNSIDGNGTLKLAGITYTNVIRLSQVIEMEMQAFGETVILTSEQFSYFNHEVGNLPLFMHSHVMYKFENEDDPINEYTYVLSTINPDQGAITGAAFTADNAPSIGDSQTMFAVNAESADALEGVTGNGVTWDYTGIYGYDGLEKEFAVTAANSADYPGATMALEYDDLATMYVSQNDYGYRVHGMEGDGGSQGSGAAKLSTPTQMFNFPFGYGSGAYFSGFGGTADFENDNHSVTDAPMLGSVFSEVDGIGTLNLPNTSYENVVRFKFIDTVYVDAHGYADDMLQTTVQYAYFDFNTSNLPIFTHTYIMFKWVGSASVIREETRVFSIDDPDFIPCNADEVPVLELADVSANQAVISWEAMEGDGPAWYGIQYRIVGEDDWTTISSGGYNTSRTLYYLESGVEYEVQIKVYCTPSNQAGEWSESLFFNTDVDNCQIAPEISVSDVNETSATISWEAITDVNWFEVRYRVLGEDTWSNTSTSASYSSKTLYSLASNTTYQAQVKTMCSVSNSSDWSNTVEFTTLFVEDNSYCTQAPSLSLLEVDATFAVITWEAYTEAPAWYEFQYRIQGDPEWISASASGNKTFRMFYYLEPERTYEVQAKVFCSTQEGDFSDWSEIFHFTTLAEYGQGLIKVDNLSNAVVKTNIDTTPEVVMYPNPTADVLNINIVLNDNKGSLSVNVFDLSGRMVVSQDVSSNEGLNTVRVSLGNLSQGMYNVIVSQDNEVIYRNKVQKK